MPGMPGDESRGTTEVRVWVAVGGGDFARYLRSALDGPPGFGYRFRATSDPLDSDVAIAEAEASPRDAIALLSGMRADERTSRLPVLFLGGGQAVRAKLLEIGDPRIALLDVPFNAHGLRAALRRMLER